MCLRLRPHHGLCTRFFEGKGYSDDFTVHMAQVIERLQQNPQLCLVLEEDEICSHCPNYGPEGCSSRDKVLAYDTAVLRLCGMLTKEQTPEKGKLDYSTLEKRIETCIIETGRLSEVCGDCEWAAICHHKE